MKRDERRWHEHLLYRERMQLEKRGDSQPLFSLIKGPRKGGSALFFLIVSFLIGHERGQSALALPGQRGWISPHGR